MSFREQLEAQPGRPASVQCSVKTWRDQQSKADQAEFDAALKSDAATIAIYRVMKSMGYTNAEGSLQRHRRQDCRCDVR